MPCSVSPELPMPIRGLRATAYETHSAVFENDFMNSPWVGYMPEGHVEMANVLFAPLNIGGETVGIMGLANKPGDFTDGDAKTASVFGELAAIALLNSRHLDLLHEKTDELQKALSEVRTLQGLLPMCARCHKVRDDEGLWTGVEEYITVRTDALVSHGLCPECVKDLYPEQAESILSESKRRRSRSRAAYAARSLIWSRCPYMIDRSTVVTPSTTLPM